MKENLNNPQSWNPVWDDVFSSQEWGKYPSENLIQFVARNFYKKVRKEIRILEVGCGTGANLWYIAREGFNAYGVDGSNVAIDIAKKRMKDETLSANLQVGDIVSLPFEDDFFDAVIDNECIYCNNLDNSHKILAEIARVMKTDAKLYSRTFSDEMFIGENPKQEGEMEYSDIKAGPLSGKGFVRLSSQDSINDLYGKHLSIESLDFLEYSSYNQEFLVKEWIVIGKK